MPAKTKGKREKHMEKAARMRHMEEMSNQQIADELGLAEKTIRNYFASDEMKQLERHYSDQDKYKLQRAVQRDLKDAENEAKSMLADAQELADSSRAYRQTAKARMEVAEKKVNLLQELGIIQKPKERREVEEKSGESVEFEMRYTSSDEEGEQDVEA